MTLDSNRCGLNFQVASWAEVVRVLGLSAVKFIKAAEKDILVLSSETEQSGSLIT